MVDRKIKTNILLIMLASESEIMLPYKRCQNKKIQPKNNKNKIVNTKTI